MVNLLLQITFIAHLLACGWFATTWIGDDVDGEGEESWVDWYEEGSAAGGPVSEQYYFSFYWAICILAATNPIPPCNDLERGYVVGVSLLNRIIFAYVVGQISSLIVSLDKQAATGD